MSLLLVIPGAADRHAALGAASAFLRYRRGEQAGAPGEDLLGIWVSEGSDALSALAPAEEPLGLHESCALEGIWTLCWLRNPALCQQDHAARRFALLERLAATAQARAGAFVPVFPAEERPDAIHAAVQALRARFPALVDGRWTVDDPAWGLMAPREALQ